MIKPTLIVERELFCQGDGFVIGCDEVGRGCLAGPVVAAAVVFDWTAGSFADREPWLDIVRDSKALSPAQRAKADALIRTWVKGFAFGVVSPQTIDRINIHQASLLAMRKAVSKLSQQGFDAPVLIDGRFTIPRFQGVQRAIVNGDADVFSIAAASIIAKEFRDRLMERLHEKFPQYGFAKHKGYATRVHREAIAAHGLTGMHRLSFCSDFLVDH